MSIMQDRFLAVEETLRQVRDIEARHGVTPRALDALKETLVSLASRTELFPEAEFSAPPGRPGPIYRLAEDPDHRFALYASAGQPGKAAPPHNHTTWAVIAGVRGREHNVFYERIDNRATEGRGRLRKTGELTVVRGNAVGFLPDDFHTIALVGDEPGLHLHLYGLSLEHLPGRIHFDGPEGDSYKVYPANANITTVAIPPAALKSLIRDGEELAILDVREAGIFERDHLLLAAPAPLSQLELVIDALVPRRTTRVVVVDGDGGRLAERAARRLFDLGWRNIALLRGGLDAWKQAGYESFSGVHVPSKAFGEFVELAYHTPHISAVELKAKIDAGAPVAILDSRPFDEFQVMSVPGGIDVPGAELVYRGFELLPDPQTLVVVNCAGRTRSIIGAQTLINAGLPNPVVALENGTMAWHLAGLTLARGRTEQAPKPGPEGLARARAAAERVAQRFGVTRIDRRMLADFEAEADQVTLYRFDVRSPEDYRAGHLPGWRSAPGGQLVQSTDYYAATRHARLVLADDDGVRAVLTASWLIQLGWRQVFVLADAFAGHGLALEQGDEPVRLVGLPPQPVLTGAAALAAHMAGRLAAGALQLVDLASSGRYRAGHIAGAVWSLRSELPALLDRLPPGPVVLTSKDGVLARYAAADLAGFTDRTISVLDGGTQAWQAAGLALERGGDGLPEPPLDAWNGPYRQTHRLEAAMQEYLDWELGLPAQLARDGDLDFQVFA